MNKSNKLLSDIVSFRTYAKHLPHLNRRETLTETIDRNKQMHLDKFPGLAQEISDAYKLVHNLEVMPSMRAMQFSGAAINVNNARQYNCAFVHIKYERVFAEILYLLLSGCGVGFSVQKRHISQLPTIKQPRESSTYIVPDSIEGWAESLNQLVNAYMYQTALPIFDLSHIREKGSYLVTTGAKAPGPEPLKHMLQVVGKKLQNAVGRRLSSVELHDIICIIADCVLAGGIRRAALISLFDKTDQDMLTCKHGEWWTSHPYRARANNSAIMHRSLTTQEEFNHVYDMCIQSNAGEPGFVWTNDLELGFNPCCEIALQSNQFCNLTTINSSNPDFGAPQFRRTIAATTIATLQAAYTSFPYLSQKWQEVTEEESLIGVSRTGIADAKESTSMLKVHAKLVLETNERVSKKLGINRAARTTTVKPEGTSSCVLGTASGVHPRYAPHYLRRVRMNANDPLAQYLAKVVPSLVEADQFDKNGVILTVPQESPVEAVCRKDVSAFTLLEQVVKYNNFWINPGHRSGLNTHNVSCTIEYEVDEVDELKSRLWSARHNYGGISLLPKSNHVYVQAPFEECTKEQFEQLSAVISEVNLSEVSEDIDGTNRSELLACAGGVCEIK